MSNLRGALALFISALLSACGTPAVMPTDLGGEDLGTDDGASADLAPPPDLAGPPDEPATITPGAADRILLRGIVVTPAGPIAGEVLVQGNAITCVAPSCAAEPGAGGATVVDTHGVILPGLLDAHNHGLFNIFDESDWTPTKLYTNHNQWTAEERYKEIVDAKQYLGAESGSPVDVRCEMDKYAELKALVAGTTSYLLAPGTARSCFSSLVRTIDTPQNGLGVDLIQTSISVPTASTAMSACANIDAGKTAAYLLHVAEGVDTTARNEFVTLQSRTCLLRPETVIVHGTALTAADFAIMAMHKMKLVWSPRSNDFLYGATTKVDEAIEAGVETIALAPDWALGGSINLLDELRYARKVSDERFVKNKLTPKRLFEMVTIDAAKALGVSQWLGSLEVGKRADILVIGGAADPYGALLAAAPATVRLVLVDGRALYGDAQLVAAGPAAPGCEMVAICGEMKFLCVAETSTQNKLDQTYVDILFALNAAMANYDSTILAGKKPLLPIAPLVRCQ